jgi:glycosyltransferase involved in cell wall biosynthesis
MTAAPDPAILPVAEAPAPIAEQLDDVVVLIPAYNCQADLDRTLASLREHSTVRVLVVDDGSEPAIEVQPLPGLQVEILRLARNGGIEQALRRGCEQLFAQGVRYIARIDAGDLATPQRLAKQRAYLEAHPGVGALGMWAAVVARTTGKPLFLMQPPTDPHQIRRQRFFRSCFVHPAMMLRAEVVQAAGNYRVAYRAAEDLDLFLRMMEHAQCANLPSVGLRYEINEAGISATRRHAQVLSTLQLQMRYIDGLNPYYWLGLLKNMLHLVVPYRVLQGIKQGLYRG